MYIKLAGLTFFDQSGEVVHEKNATLSVTRRHIAPQRYSRAEIIVDTHRENGDLDSPMLYFTAEQAEQLGHLLLAQASFAKEARDLTDSEGRDTI